MFTKIDCIHGYGLIEKWFEEYADEVPPDFPTDRVLKLLWIIMTNSIFHLIKKFGFEYVDPTWQEVAPAFMLPSTGHR